MNIPYSRGGEPMAILPEFQPEMQDISIARQN